MSDNKNNDKTNERRLTDIVRDVKIAAADHRDVVVDIRDADKARLEILADELAPVIADIDPADDRFDMGISSGQQPRFWVDAVAHVHMGPDRRIYRFVRDTRLGRVLLSESSAVTETADQVARYVAERIVEREQLLSGDFQSAANRGKIPDAELKPSHQVEGSAKWPLPMETASGTDAASIMDAKSTAQKAAKSSVADDAATPSEPLAEFPERKQGRGAGFVIGASWFILGCVAGAAALVVAFWDRISGLIS